MSKTFNRLRRALEKLVAPSSNISYAQAGEDLLLDALLDHRPTGFYVDVGCNHPTRISNTYRFYRKGWTGICIDANRDFEKHFRRKRPRDVFLQALISVDPGTSQFHVFEENALSSVSGDMLYNNTEQYKLRRVDSLETRTLTDVLDACSASRHFDLLSIDVEG